MNLLKRILTWKLMLLRDLLDPILTFREVAILAYHSISESMVPTAVSKEAFRRQLELLRKKGYRFVSLDQIRRWQEGSEAFPRKAVAITFDDGYEDFETAALPILEAFRAPTTLFLVGDDEHSRTHLGNDIPLLSREALEQLREHPLITFGYHSKSHPKISSLTGSALIGELEPTFATAYFAYPGGNYSPEAVEALGALGYDSAYSIKPTLVSRGSDRFLMPRSVVTRDMTPGAVRFHATKALDWYRFWWRRMRGYA